MTIHVNIGEAKTRLSQLIAAAEAGEDVVIDRAGQPSVRLEPVTKDVERERVRAQREAWFGSGRETIPDGFAESAMEPAYTEEEWEEFLNEPLDPAERTTK